MKRVRIIGIAVNDYEDTDLNKIENCQNDLQQVTSLLQSKYIIEDVELLYTKTQTTRSNIYNFLKNYLYSCIDNDSVIIFFAGHGQYDNKLNATFWLPSDAIRMDMSTWFNLSDLITFIKFSKALHIVVVSDSCFAGGLFQSALRGGGITAIENKKSRLALTSGNLEPVSDGTKGSISPFANSLCKLLNENEESELPFTKLAHDLIVNFKSDISQTPVFGSLENTGHEGGTLILRVNSEKNSFNNFYDHSIDLDFNFPLNITYNCRIPVFRKNNFSNFSFINSTINNIAFDFVNDIRNKIEEFINEVVKGEIHPYLNIDYNIHTYNSMYLSMMIKVEDFFQSAYPNNKVFSVNFKFNPDRKFRLDDLLDYDDIQGQLKKMIKKYSNINGQEPILQDCLDKIHYSEIDFSFDKSYLYLYFVNHVIRAVHAYGNIEIPIGVLKLKINL